MSVLNEKRNIFSFLKQLPSFQDVPKLKDNFNLDSLKKEDGDPIEFLTDIIVVLFGELGLRQVLAKIVTNINSQLEKKIKDGLKSLLKSISSDKNLGYLSNKSFTVGLKEIDLFNIVNNNTNVDNLIKSDLFNDTFYSTLFSAINDSGKEKVFAGFISMIFFNNKLIIKFTDSIQNLTTSSLIDQFIDNINLINSSKIFVDLVNTIFGSLFKLRKKSIKDIENEVFIEKFIDAIVTDTVFRYNVQENEKEILSKYEGVSTLDFGCDNAQIVINENDIIDVYDTIKTNDEVAIAQSFQALQKQSISNSGVNQSDENYKNNFHKNFLKKILMVIIKNIVFAIPLVLLLLILYIIKNNINLSNGLAVLATLNVLIKLNNSSISQANFTNKHNEMFDKVNDAVNTINSARQFIQTTATVLGTTFTDKINTLITNSNLKINSINNTVANINNNIQQTDEVYERLLKELNYLNAIIKDIETISDLIINFKLYDLMKKPIECLLPILRPFINGILFDYARKLIIKLVKPYLEKITKELVDNQLKVYLSLVGLNRN